MFIRATIVFDKLENALIIPEQADITSVAFSPDGRFLLASHCGLGPKDSPACGNIGAAPSVPSAEGRGPTSELWRIDPRGGAHLAPPLRLDKPAGRVAFLDGSRVLLGDDDGSLSMIDGTSGTLLASGDNHGCPITAMVLDAGRHLVATGAKDGTIALSNARDCKPFALGAHGAGILALAFGPAGLLFSAGEDMTIATWSL
jgi:WD40 repeat protein